MGIPIDELERRLARAKFCLQKAIKEGRTLDAFQQQRRVWKVLKKIKKARAASPRERQEASHA